MIRNSILTFIKAYCNNYSLKYIAYIEVYSVWEDSRYRAKEVRIYGTGPDITHYTEKTWEPLLSGKDVLSRIKVCSPVHIIYE